MEAHAARRVMIVVALLCSMSTPALGAALEETVDLITGLELGQSLEALQKRFPDLELLKAPSGDRTRDSYLASWDHPLIQRISLGIRETKLRSLGTFTGSFDGGWEPADAVVKYSTALLEKISERWGPGDLRLWKFMGQKSISATWRREGEVLFVKMTAPDELLAQAGQNKNPSATFIFMRFVEAQEPDLRKQVEARHGEDSPTTIDQFAVDYRMYRARMEVQPKKGSEVVFPSGLKGVFIGMTTSELRDVRPELMSGDFGDDRYAFYDRIGDREIDANYRARMDRLVAVVLSDSKMQKDSRDVFETWDEWLVRSWGTPDYIRWRLYKPGLTKESMFVWERDDCDSAVAVAAWRKRVIRLAVFEKGLDPGLNFAGFGEPHLVGTTRDESTVKKAWTAFLEERDPFMGLDEEPVSGGEGGVR